ncbi:MAG: hypothetical protein JNJ45_07550 [Chthonomonas sp.]|nr:hypothetical protein [Chthonomonas sp.]
MKKQPSATPLTVILVVVLLASLYLLWIRPMQSPPKVEVSFERSVPAATPK